MSVALPSKSIQARSLLSTYQPAPGAYDELFDASRTMRPHWSRLMAAIEGLGVDELGRRWEVAKRVIHENGITYNVYADPQGMERPWELDPIPLVLPAAEWHDVAAGLAQRARLLNMILADLYGPQTLVQQGLLPPEFILAHPGFLRPCHGIRLPHKTFLHLYATHLARASDGRWCVLADRTQAPMGAGYAVENRIVISRMLPHVFHECQVQRLASFFIALRETLHGLAPHHRDNPRIVLLSSGPRSSTYFEDAYLARYLGYTLVTGGDLAVRDCRAYLKTLGGLLPVDVILRRFHDDDCDPLELRGGSPLGVPGLVQAVRSGNVAVANALGSGVLEAPALMVFLPALCRHFFGEELLAPSVPTWWCARDADRDYVLRNLDSLVIKPAFPHRQPKPVFCDRLKPRERQELIAAIEARPRDFVAQQQIARSAAPVWYEPGLQPRHVALRAFAVAHGDSYTVMPGGLTRISAMGKGVSDSMSAGEGSKDVWVLSDGPVNPVSLLHPAGQAVKLRRSGNELPSRVADNLFWLGRQVERAEGAVRLLRSIITRISSEAQPQNLPELTILLRALADPVPLFAEADARQTGTPQELERAMLNFIFDPHRQGSLRSTLTSVHELAAIVRDRVSSDSWRILNRMDQDFLPLGLQRSSIQLGDVLSLFNQLIMDLAAFSGLGLESMTRTQAWRFLDMGRRLERAVHTSALLQSTLVAGPTGQPAVLEALLEIADSSMTYRSRYLTTLQLPPVLDLLLTDETNPRSVAFQLEALAEHVRQLPRDQSGPSLTTEERIVLAAKARLGVTEVANLCRVDARGRRARLDSVLTKLTELLRRLSDSIAHTYLIHAGPSRQMADLQPGEPT